jgi:type I restriction enzyme S subunit
VTIATDRRLLRRLRSAATNVTRKISEPSLPLIQLEDVEAGAGRLAPSYVPSVGSETEAIAFERNDVLFAKLRPYLVKVVHATEPGRAVGEFLVLRADRDALEPRFLYYLLRSKPLVDWTVATSYGVKMPRTSWDILSGFRVELPPREEQRTIVGELDEAVGRTNDLIDAKRALLDLIDAKRNATVTAAVIGERLPGPFARVPAAIASASAIPAHWDVLSLRRVVARFIDYRGATPEKALTGVPLVTARNVKRGQIELSAAPEYVAESDYDEWMRRGLPDRGDVLLTTEAPLGEVAQVTDPRIALAQRIILLRADESRIDPAYLKYFLWSGVGQAELWSRATGSTALGIKAERLKDVKVVVPPLDEQRLVVADLDVTCGRLAELGALIKQQITLLAEHRDAMIASAVARHFRAGEWEEAA